MTVLKPNCMMAKMEAQCHQSFSFMLLSLRLGKYDPAPEETDPHFASGALCLHTYSIVEYMGYTVGRYRLREVKSC